MNDDAECIHLPQSRVLIAEVQVSATPILFRTLLGSCVALCLHDAAAGKGGVNHIALPGGSPGSDTRFAAPAIRLLIQRLVAIGCTRSRLVAKAYGGAQVLDCIRTPVGTRNAEFVRSFLREENIPLVDHRLGGTAALDISFRSDTGSVFVRSLPRTRQPESVLPPELSLLRATPLHLTPATTPRR